VALSIDSVLTCVKGVAQSKRRKNAAEYALLGQRFLFSFPFLFKQKSPVKKQNKKRSDSETQFKN